MSAQRPARPPPPLALDDRERAILASLKARQPDADPLRWIPDVPPSRVPRHIAVIMDGNGRWAQAQGMPREFGHREGAKAVRRFVEHAGHLGVEVVTLYSFSMENWKRPAHEVRALMELCLLYLASEEPELVQKSIRFRVIGRRAGLPRDVVDAIERVERATRTGTRGTLCLAINYGSRAELCDAAAALARDVLAGRLSAQDIDEAAFASRLYTADLPDPDLLIRTAGEMRLSNYLLWQISYAELYVTPTLWPEFGSTHLEDAIRAYAKRERRFGAVDAPNAATASGVQEHA